MSQEVIIVGAPRSGTNMLRDVLVSLPGFATWPCDEINLIWRHGNRTHPDDELSADQATPEVARFVRRQFDHLRSKSDSPVVVEKTCATSLRVDFTRKIFPEAKYLFITRDGVDAAASAAQRWHAPFDLGYTAAKARFVPPADVAYYGAKFVANHVRRRVARSHRSSEDLATWWGPKPRDYRSLMAHRPLDEVCMLQWQRCVERATEGFADADADGVFHISYEAFVQAPTAQLQAILSFLGRDPSGVESAVATVARTSIGKGREELGGDAVRRLERIGDPMLRRYGYV